MLVSEPNSSPARWKELHAGPITEWSRFCSNPSMSMSNRGPGNIAAHFAISPRGITEGAATLLYLALRGEDGCSAVLARKAKFTCSARHQYLNPLTSLHARLLCGKAVVEHCVDMIWFCLLITCDTPPVRLPTFQQIRHTAHIESCLAGC